jgi:DNA polymerase-3 subunit gamma/tau
MSSNTLYRKYRPQRFADLIGQSHIATTLTNEVNHKQLSHAYLFSGPRGVGKTTTARLLAKAANCLKPKAGEPDNACTACTAITEGKTLDVIEIDAASYTGVDNIREVIEHSRFSPSQLTYKVFIVDEVHMLSAAAFNALLKTLEEPPSHVIFILATTEIHKVPETILSRCQRFDFHRLGEADLAKRLRWMTKEENRSVDDEVIQTIVRLADGSSRDAESILGQLFALGEKKITRAEADIILPRSNEAAVADLIVALLRNAQAEALGIIRAQLDQGIDLEAFRTDVIRLLRDCLLYRVLPQGQRPSIPAIVIEHVTAASPALLVRTLENFLSVAQYVSVSPLPQLPLELAVLQSTNTPNDGAAVASPPKMQPEKPQRAEAAPGNNPSQDLFTRMVRAVTEQAPMLSVPLKMFRLTGVQDNTYTLSGPYALHVERLQHPKAKAKLEEIASEVVGSPVVINVRHDGAVTLDVPVQVPHNTPAAPAPSNPTAQNPDQLWDQIVNAFNS